MSYLLVITLNAFAGYFIGGPFWAVATPLMGVVLLTVLKKRGWR